MAHHELKVWPDFYPAIADGSKPFEIRKNDRNYQVGDTLRLREYSPGPAEYTGREATRRVTYMLSGDDVQGYAFGVRQGFVALGLRTLPAEPGVAAMTDIVERLRQHIEPYTGFTEAETLMHEAANEIERLRTENKTLRATVDRLFVQWCEAESKEPRHE